jgi:hypothetical protein
MIDNFAHFYESLNPLGRFIFDFIGGTVILRGILAHKLAAWILRKIAQMDVFGGDMLGFIMKHVSQWNTVARKVALVQHFRNGHTHEGVVGCTEENCGMFLEPQVNRFERPIAA